MECKLKHIYLDYNATTPILPEVLKEMLPYLKNLWGNPSSPHWAGEKVKNTITTSKERIASTLNCDPDEIFFTSCGTESSNWVLKISNLLSAKKNKNIITTKVEHDATLNTCQFLQKYCNTDVTYLDVDHKGNLSLEQLKSSINEGTILISVMYANNETGVIFPIKEIGEIAEKHGIPFHTDAIQAYGKIPIDLKQIKVDFLSISGHKVYSPKGIGALFIRKGKELIPFIHGGGQQRGLRSGTENIPGIVALGKSSQIILRDFEDMYSQKLEKMRDSLENYLLNEIKGLTINSDTANRLPNTSNICFHNIESSALIKALSYEGIAVSAGSACASEKESYSHVLKAMGRSKMEALSSLRISLGRGLSERDIIFSAKKISYWVNKLRSFSPQQ